MMPLAAINWHSFLFLLSGGLACAFALGVLFSNNVVRMAFYLIISLASTAGLFMLAGANFLGAMQIMIYVGGTLVLLIFGVMLTAQATFVSMKTSGGEWIAGLIVGGALLLVLVQAATSIPAWTTVRPDQNAVAASEIESASSIGQSLIGVRVDGLHQEDATQVAGLSGYILPFEIISIHLLVVLIGAAFLARATRKVPAGADPS
jgi:NADH-quinone oxidoreductase subunit J